MKQWCGLHQKVHHRLSPKCFAYKQYLNKTSELGREQAKLEAQTVIVARLYNRVQALKEMAKK